MLADDLLVQPLVEKRLGFMNSISLKLTPVDLFQKHMCILLKLTGVKALCGD